jgi:hypothetical protein
VNRSGRRSRDRRRLWSISISLRGDGRMLIFYHRNDRPGSVQALA